MDEKEKQNKDLELQNEGQAPVDEPEVVQEEGQAINEASTEDNVLSGAPDDETEKTEETEETEETDGLLHELKDGEAFALLSESAGDGDNANSSGSNGKSGKVWPIVSLVLAILLVAALVVPKLGSNKNDVVATVNGTKITTDQFLDELKKTGTGSSAVETLEMMITEILINQEAEKANLTVTEAEIDKEVDTMKESFGSEENLNQALQYNGMTMEQLRNNIKMNALLTKILGADIEVTDEEIKQTFEENKSYFDTPEQVRTSIILVETEAEAEAIIKELKEGKDFAELAKSKSLDETTKENGGDTGFYGRGEMDEAVEEEAFKLAKDEISSPVKTADGYQVIKVTDRQEAHEATLEESKEEIRTQLINQKVSEKTGTWIEEVRSKSTITNVLTDTEASSATN